MRRSAFTGEETLRVGICDVIAKTLAFRLLQPACAAGLAMRLICREDRFDDFVFALTVHMLDLVISDHGLATGALRGYTQLLGRAR